MSEERAPRGRVEPPPPASEIWKAHPNANPARYGYTRKPAGYTRLQDAVNYVLRDLLLITAGECDERQLKASVSRCKSILDGLMSDIASEAAEDFADGANIQPPETEGH